MAEFDIKRLLLKGLALMLPLSAALPALSAESDTLTYKIYFPQGSSVYHQSFDANKSVVDSIHGLARSLHADSAVTINGVRVSSSCSPEGSLPFNVRLAVKRAATLQGLLPDFGVLPRVSDNISVNWEGVTRLVAADSAVPYRDEALALLNGFTKMNLTPEEESAQISSLRRLRDGKPYLYIYTNIFPKLRYAELMVNYDRIMPAEPNAETTVVTPPVTEEIIQEETVAEIVAPECSPFYMDFRTNMLYDALAVPNIGVDFYLGKNISLGLNWMYAWWSKNSRHRYWRIYGGDLNARWWFGRRAHEKPLTGHHLGLYAQMLTYDFEFGGKGYMGGEPGDNIWARMSYGGGLEYGYSLPVARRLNIDFTIGVGYLGGKYYEYIPLDGCYVWQATKNRHWFGPTKAEISLVWLIGCGNKNHKK